MYARSVRCFHGEERYDSAVRVLDRPTQQNTATVDQAVCEVGMLRPLRLLADAAAVAPSRAAYPRDREDRHGRIVLAALPRLLEISSHRTPPFRVPSRACGSRRRGALASALDELAIRR